MTPGKWTMDRHGKGSDYGEGAYTLWPHGVIVESGLSREDARAIAEVPMMLATLRETLATLSDPDASDFDAARLESAIAGLIRRIDGEAP